jgi:branched-subunit amino acid ABC-type transport system permease component
VILAALLLAALGTLLAPPASASPLAQETEDAYSIKGTLRDEDREPLEGVRLTGEGEGGSAETVTDDAGRWELRFPAGGTYAVELDESTLPSGVSLAPDESNPREVSFGSTSNAGVIFRFGSGSGSGEDGASSPAPSDAGGDAGTGGSAGEADSAQPGAEPEGTAPPAAGRSFWVVLGERALAGLTFGLILGLAAVGLSLVYGTTGLNNFSHGETVTLGAVAAFFLSAAGLPFWAAALGAVVVGGLYGYLNDTVLWKPLRDRRAGLVPMMIVSIGFALTMRYVLLFFFGGSTRQLPGAQSQVLRFGPFGITVNNLTSMLIALVIIIAIALVLSYSRLGKATRAVADNPALASASGINVDRVIRLVWIIGAALAALAGILYAFYRPGVTFNMGQQILLMIFAAVTLGGLGTIYGALIGSVFVGLLTEISTIWLAADLKYVGALLMMILVLIFRPQGLLGRKDRIG